MRINNNIKEAINNPRYAIFYKGKEVTRFPFYRQGKAYCLKHNKGYDTLPFPEVEDRCILVDLKTGEELNNQF